MFKRIILKVLAAACLSVTVAACSIPAMVERSASKSVPASYNNSQDTTNTARLPWKQFFTDTYLTALIDTALHHNQELHITLQEIEIAKSEARIRKGEYLPFVGIRGGAGLDKVGRYTQRGSSEATTDIKPGKETPEPLPDFFIGAFATWEVDIWHKLRNSRKAALSRYLASVEGKNFMVTNLIAEIANSYYELLALDYQLENVKKNIALQTNALQIVKLQKEATRVNELAVRRFEAQMLKTQSLQYDIQQQITETENRINFLVGRYPQPIGRSTQDFTTLVPATIAAGLPGQLLENRPDIKQAELDLEAARLDVKVARASFYPSLGLSAGIGLQAFDPTLLLQSPESLLLSLAGDVAAPLVNRNGIKAVYSAANARQMQAIFNYERVLLKAYLEVANQVSRMSNLEKSYALQAGQVRALTESIDISDKLFKSARADYMEVLLTQRDALESRMELIETKKKQMNAMVQVYQALGGGWR
ncbi:MAG: TolC family protein [Adhaeribacter sp.]